MNAPSAAVDLAELLPVLERTPVLLRAWLDGLPGAWTDCDEGPGTWSPYVVVGHLIHGERTDWMPRVRHILERRSGPFVPFDREGERGARAPLADRLALFADLRAANLAELRALTLAPADLALPGIHPALGPVTLGQLLATWAAHDLDHVAQIARTMAKRYGAAVGPWAEYLSVLGDRR